MVIAKAGYHYFIDQNNVLLSFSTKNNRIQF
jgi:hypothetical protein